MTQNSHNSWRDVIPVYRADGQKVKEIVLPEKILPIPSKRGGFSGSGTYYKGSGIVYQGHLVNELSNNVRLLEKTRIIYEKYHVCYPDLVGRFGIFLFPHQAVFTDCEGGCGKKEKKLVQNQEQFERSAIKEITDIIDTGIPEHSIYAFRLKQVSGGIEDTAALLEYVLSRDFNTAWDKNLWGDIYAYGYVRDIADWFVSDQPNHKLGTVYALLNSLYRADKNLYAMLLLHLFHQYSFEKRSILQYSAQIVEKFCPGAITEGGVQIKQPDNVFYEKMLTLLFSGKACCHLEEEEKWQWVYGELEQVKKRQLERF